jgi:hypothetical protein
MARFAIGCMRCDLVRASRRALWSDKRQTPFRIAVEPGRLGKHRGESRREPIRGHGDALRVPLESEFETLLT